MKSITSVLSIIALGFGLLSCSGSGGGGGGGVAFAITTTAAPSGVVGNAYSATLATIGGTAPLTWILVGGVLPNGLSLNGATGVVSGIPTAAGSSTTTFMVTDSTGKTASSQVLIVIHPRTDRLSVSSDGVSGDGASSSPSIDSTGRLVAFASLATNLLGPSGPTISGQQVYVHDWQTNESNLISKNGAVVLPTGGNGVSSAPSVSGDGNFVAFVSLAPDLLPAGSPAIVGTQVYLHNRTTGQTSLISKNGTAGVLTGGNGVSSAPSISSDGNLIAFVSSAPDLLPAGSPVVSGQQIYFHNRVAGQTSLVSKNNEVPAVQGDGLSDTPSINAEATNAIGGFVAFMSLSGNLASGGGQHVYARAIP